MKKIDKMLKEVSAEIVAGKVPASKVFDVKGNIVPLDQLKGSNSQQLLVDVKAALEKAGLLPQFAKNDLSNIDIKPFRKNMYILTSEAGPKYLYNVATKKISKT